MHDLQLTQFDHHSADVSLKISWLTLKLCQLKFVHNTEIKMNGLHSYSENNSNFLPSDWSSFFFHLSAVANYWHFRSTLVHIFLWWLIQWFTRDQSSYIVLIIMSAELETHKDCLGFFFDLRNFFCFSQFFSAAVSKVIEARCVIIKQNLLVDKFLLNFSIPFVKPLAFILTH